MIKPKVLKGTELTDTLPALVQYVFAGLVKTAFSQFLL